MLCRRDKPRSAFEAQIREERGTGSALTADADESGDTRFGANAAERAKCEETVGSGKQRRRRKAGVE
jgi:hypothetical protein